MDPLLSLFNIASGLIFVALGFAAFFRMAWRVGNFYFFKVPVPVLLKRDVALFATLSFYFGSAILALIAGWTGLNHEPIWVVPRALVVLISMAYWVWVEYHLEDGKD